GGGGNGNLPDPEGAGLVGGLEIGAGGGGGGQRIGEGVVKTVLRNVVEDNGRAGWRAVRRCRIAARQRFGRRGRLEKHGGGARGIERVHTRVHIVVVIPEQFSDGRRRGLDGACD